MPAVAGSPQSPNQPEPERCRGRRTLTDNVVSVNPRNEADYRDKMLSKTKNSFAEVDDWMNEFFPQEEKDHRAYLVNCVGQRAVDDVEASFKNLQIPRMEASFYEHLCGIFNTLLSHVRDRTGGQQTAGERFIFHQTSDHPENTDCPLKPDICLFPRPTEKFQVPEGAPRAHVRWSWIEFPIEVKVDADYAPFNFDDRPLDLKPTVEGQRSRAQLIKYASEVQLHQHRTFAVTVWIQRDWLRLLFWDRNGAVVSRAMNFTADPIPFMSFLCRYVTASRADRGHDPTVERASAAQVECLQAYAKEIWNSNAASEENSEKYHQSVHLRRMLRDTDTYPIEVLTARDEAANAETKQKEEHKYLVGPHRVGPHRPTGRACKGYVAYDIDRNRLVWIKNYWCADGEDVSPEVEVYRLLRRHEVRNIPTLLAGGDVGGPKAQRTRSDRYLNDKRSGVSLLPRYHQRLILQELCRSLESHRDENELICCMRDAAIAYHDGYEKAGILHRDVSPGNILIDIATNKGLLSDWELAKSLNKLHGRPSQPNRSGTWVSMSSLLQWCPYKPYEVTDDLESFLHVTEYKAAQFYKHRYSPENQKGDVDVRLNSGNKALAEYVQRRFLMAIEVGQCTVGNDGRVPLLFIGRSELQLDRTKSPKLAPLLDKLCGLFAPLYNPDNVDECRKRWGPRAKLTANFPQMQPVPGRPTPATLVKVLEDHAALPGEPGEKVRDQFRGLPTLNPLVPTIGTGTGSKRSWSEAELDTGTRSKRCRSEAGSDTATQAVPPSRTLAVPPTMTMRPRRPPRQDIANSDANAHESGDYDSEDYESDPAPSIGDDDSDYMATPVRKAARRR